MSAIFVGKSKEGTGSRATSTILHGAPFYPIGPIAAHAAAIGIATHIGFFQKLLSGGKIQWGRFEYPDHPDTQHLLAPPFSSLSLYYFCCNA